MSEKRVEGEDVFPDEPVDAVLRAAESTLPTPDKQERPETERERKEKMQNADDKAAMELAKEWLRPAPPHQAGEQVEVEPR